MFTKSKTKIENWMENEKKCRQLAFLAQVLWKKSEILLWQNWQRRHCQSKTLTFCNICAITRDISFKLKMYVLPEKANRYHQGR